MHSGRRRKRKRHQQLALFVGQAPGPSAHKAATATLRAGNDLDSPVPHTPPSPAPLSGAAGARLARLAGVPAPDLWKICHRKNLIEAYPGKKPISKIKLRHSFNKGEEYTLHQSAGDHFPLQQARENATRMDLAPYALVIVLGLNVARAFRLPNAKLFKRYRWEPEKGKRATPIPSSGEGAAFDGQTMILVFPHPSGVSHFWNTISNRRHAQQELRRALADTGVLEQRTSPYFLRNRPSVYFTPAKASAVGQQSAGVH